MGCRDSLRFIPEFPGGACRYCGVVTDINSGLKSCKSYTTCSATGTQQTGFTCSGRFGGLTCSASQPGPAFTNTITCGATSTTITCGTCSGGTLQQTYAYNVQQKCH